MGRCACDEVVRLVEAEGRVAKRPQGPARTRRAERVPSDASSFAKATEDKEAAARGGGIEVAGEEKRLRATTAFI